MELVPGEAPETMPVAEPMVATPGVAEDQVPPPASVKVVAAPAHRDREPEMAAGRALTVMIVLVTQPVGSV